MAQEVDVLFEGQGITISAQLVDCEDTHNGTHKQYYLLTTENKNPNAKAISFKKELWYDGKCLSCTSESEEYVARVEVGANSSKSGECRESDQLRVFVKMLNLQGVRQLTHFELTNISVTDVE